MRTAFSLAAPALLISANAMAIAPASEEQLVCTPTALFHGTVKTARSTDCKLRLHEHDGSCDPQNFAAITVQIDAIMPAGLGSLRVGETKEFSTRFCNMKPINIGGKLTDMCSLNDRDLAVRRDGLAATDRDVTEAFVGHSFYFTLWSNGPQVDTWTRPDHALAIWSNVCPSSPYRQRSE